MASVTIREVTGEDCPPPLNPWINTIVARLPNVTVSMVEVELENTLAEFCKQSQVWQETIGPETIVASEDTIYLNPYEQDKIILYVSSVFYKDAHLAPVATLGTQYNKTTSGVPSCFFSPEPSVVRLIPTPTVAPPEGFYFRAIFMPRDASVWLPDFFANTYFEVVLSGALARLHSHTAKPYSNQAAAIFHERRFRSLTAEAKAIVKSGNVAGGEIAWSYPSWALI